MTLSLMGPGTYSKIKDILMKWILAHYKYVFEDVPVGAGASADNHRQRTWYIYFRHVSGKTQRRNRLKHFVIIMLPNGDIRKPNFLEHFCKRGCCHGEKDVDRKLHRFVAIVAGEMCKVYPRSRWTGMEESQDLGGSF